MKKIILMFVLLVSCAAGNAQQSLFNKYGDEKGISTVYISKAMLGLVSGMKVGDISKIAGDLDCLQILECDRPSMIPAVKAAAQEAFRNEKFEQMMKMKDDGDTVVIYHKAHKNGKNEFSMLCIDSKSLQVINIVGNVTLDDIKSLNM